jgi:hypothetical protein
MRTLFFFLVSGLLNTLVSAQGVKYEDQTKDLNKTTMYCAALIDGKMILKDQNQKPTTLEVTLTDGTKITTDGTVIRKDGSKTALKNGECIDTKGNIEKVKVDNMERK